MREREGAEQGGRTPATDEPACWRWLAMLLVLAMHIGIYALLRSTGGDEEPVREHETQRIRLAWVERERSTPVPPMKRSDRTGAKEVARPAPRRAAQAEAREHAREAAPALHIEDGAWSRAPGAAPGLDPGTDFAPDPFRRLDGSDPFAPVERMPNLRMRDTSLGGWLQGQSRRRACGELKAALGRQPESTHAILASMRRWNCTL